MKPKTENFWRPYLHIIGKGQPGERTYLIRLHLTPFPWWKGDRWYLHIFGRPDAEGEALHDHPWDFQTRILFGGYDEMSHHMEKSIGDWSYDAVEDMTYWRNYVLPTGTYDYDVLKFGDVRKRDCMHAHKITRLHSPVVITLVRRSNKTLRDWGFWVPVPFAGKDEDGGPAVAFQWTPWKEYRGVK